MNGEILSIETAERIAALEKANEKLNNDKRGMLIQLYKANDERDMYKSRNEKAIEYIKTTNFWGLYDNTPMIDVKYGEDLLNILTSGDEE